MKIITVQDPDTILKSLRTEPNKDLKRQVNLIIENVQSRGDTALRQYEKRFTKFNLHYFKVSDTEIKIAYNKVSKNEINAIKIAKKRLEKTELAIKKQLHNLTLMTEGVKINKVFSPIDSVGCYIPGGKARYPSSLLMSVIPAKVAGVKKVIAVSPVDKKGSIDPLILVSADICGVDEFYKIGGAQAIAALAYGTETIPKVDKIVGPGGKFVTMAKSLLSAVVSIDMMAGPTELAIIGDSTTNPNLAALDLVSQAEHSTDTMCCLITTSRKLKDDVLFSLKQMKGLERSQIVKESLSKNGFIAMCKSEEQLIEFTNKLAPEHLEIMIKNPRNISKKITSAGLTLIGKNTPSSASDYLLGSNHILPTNGFGRTRGSLGVLDYLKIVTTVESSKDVLKNISKYMKILTDAEGLPNHYESVKGRLT